MAFQGRIQLSLEVMRVGDQYIAAMTGAGVLGLGIGIVGVTGDAIVVAHQCSLALCLAFCKPGGCTSAQAQSTDTR